MTRLLFLAWLFLVGADVLACPWCKTNALQKPTVEAGTPDPGGTFFGQAPDPKLTRRYYVAAEPVQWNFVPQGKDPVRQAVIPPTLLNRPVSNKIRYVQYTDDSFTVRATEPTRLGILGPVLRGQVGEFLAVTFLNRSDRPLSMHPHGVKYDKDSEGASYFPERGRGAAIAPQARFTYVWQLDQASGPLPREPSSKGWLYHSHVAGEEEINQGLFGFIIVTDPARARVDSTPADVDREQAALFMIFDETPPEEEEAGASADVAKAGPEYVMRRLSESLHDMKQRELGARHAINGFVFGNLDGLEMCQNERVRWYLFALGSETDLHSAHWHGARLIAGEGRRTDVVELLPGSMVVADMVADNPGRWLFHCHVADHMMEGMYAGYAVLPLAETNAVTGPAFFSEALPPRALRLTAFSARLGDDREAAGKLAGEFEVSNPLTGEGTLLELELAGVKRRFQLDSQGKAAASDDHLALSLSQRDTSRPGVIYRLDFQFAGTAWREALAKAGLANAKEPKVVNLPVLLTLNGRPITGLAALRFEPSSNQGGVVSLR